MEKSAKRVRYTAEKRSEVIAFIKDYNAKNKRGGQKVAAEEYGITSITLSNWMKKEKTERKGGKTVERKSRSSVSSAEYARVFSKLADIHSQIAVLEKQLERLDSLRKEATELRKSMPR